LFASEMHSSKAMIVLAVGFWFRYQPTARTSCDHFVSLHIGVAQGSRHVSSGFSSLEPHWT
jgi:hypothetical protein